MTSNDNDTEKQMASDARRDSEFADDIEEEHETPTHEIQPVIEGEKTSSQQPQLSRTITSSSYAPSVKVTPRSKRHGLLASLCLLYEAEEPKHYPRNIKWFITFWVAVAAMAAPMGSSIIYPALSQITTDFGTTPFLANFSVALYQLALSIFPLWWSSFSEAAGRRTVYVVSFSLYLIWNILAAESTSISMFIIMRILSGGCAAAVQSVGAGTVADIWAVKERGTAMGIFYIGPLCGPLLSPVSLLLGLPFSFLVAYSFIQVIGGALTEGFDWRATQWFQAIYGGVVLIAIILVLPETHIHSKILAEAEQTLQRTTSNQNNLSRTSTREKVTKETRKYVDVAYQVLVDPLKMITYLRFPAVALTVYYAAIAFGTLYFLNISVETTFSKAPYNFSEIIIGCLYLFNSVGYFLASVFGGPWVDKIMAREARRAGRIDARGKLQYRPEDRMRENVWLAAFLMPGALIWYGWSAQYGVQFAVPMIANFFFGVGSMLLFGAATTMLTEFMPKQSSAGVALNNFVRNIFAFIATFTAEPAISNIGNGWLFTIVGLISLASCIVIPTMRRYSPKWRVEMEKVLG